MWTEAQGEAQGAKRTAMVTAFDRCQPNTWATRDCFLRTTCLGQGGLLTVDRGAGRSTKRRTHCDCQRIPSLPTQYVGNSRLRSSNNLPGARRLAHCIEALSSFIAQSCVFLFICLSASTFFLVCIDVWLCVRPCRHAVRRLWHKSVCLSVRLSSKRLSQRFSLSVLSVWLSVCLSDRLSVCLSLSVGVAVRIVITNIRRHNSNTRRLAAP